MKLSTGLATLIAIQRHGHRMCASADNQADAVKIKIKIKQAEAAKRVNDIVKIALASVDEGDVRGVALPLNYVVVQSGGEQQQQLTVALRLPKVDRVQQILVDTGSSSLAFCDESLIEEAAAGITKTDYVQCNGYGDSLTCPGDSSTDLTDIFFVGQVFQGNVAAYDIINEKEIASMDNVYFGIMSKEQMYPCSGPLDGIIGVAYKGLNTVYKTPSPQDFDVLKIWKQSCETNDPLYKSVGTCNTANLAEVTLPAPLDQSLKADVDSGYNSAEAFGLYCDYAATSGSEKDTIVPSLGIYFGGNLALNNKFYNNGTPQVAEVFGCESIANWYQLILYSIRVPGMDMKQSGFDQCNECSKCYTDSGTSWISLPLQQSFCDDLSEMRTSDDEKLKDLGSLLLDLEGPQGVNGNTITLSLPLVWLAEQIRLENVECSGLSGDFILGFPIFQYYYVAYDMGKDTVTFVNLPLSNEPKPSTSKRSEL